MKNVDLAFTPPQVVAGNELTARHTGIRDMDTSRCHIET